MESVYDTELEEVSPKVYVQNSTETHQYEDFFSTEETERTGDNKIVETMNLDVDSNIAQTQSEIVVTVNNEPKTFEQSGFEVTVIVALGVIVGLIVWNTISKRWHP